MRTRSKLWTAAVALCVPWLLLLAPLVGATPPSAVENPVPADLKLILPDSIALGEPFYLTFQVKMTGGVKRLTNETDLISISLPQCCRVDSGTTNWRGHFDKGDFIELKVKLRVTQPCREFFEGYVYTSAAPNRTPATYSRISRITSRTFAIGLQGMPQSDTTSIGTSKIRFVDTIETRTPESLLWHEPQRPPETHQMLSLESLKSGRAKITYDAGRETLFGVTKYQGVRYNKTIKFMPADCFASTAGIAVKSLPQNVFQLQMVDSLDSAYVTIHVDQSSYSVLVVRRTTSWVGGRFLYLDNTLDTDARGNRLAAK